MMPARVNPWDGIWTLQKASLFNDHSQSHSYHLLSAREEVILPDRNFQMVGCRWQVLSEGIACSEGKIDLGSQTGLGYFPCDPG